MLIIGAYFAVQYAALFLNITDQNALHLKWIGPIFTIGLNFYRINSTENSLYNFVSMLNYDFIFMAQGVIDQIYLQEQLKHRGKFTDTIMVPIGLLIFFIIYALAAPVNQNAVGDVFSYPLYTTHWLQTVYLIGTWNWIYVNIWIAIQYLNSKFDDDSYKLINGSSMWAYLSHYLFIVIVEKQIVRRAEMSFVPAIGTAIVCSELAILGSYLILRAAFGFGKKER